jgi:hypothetical protein
VCHAPAGGNQTGAWLGTPGDYRDDSNASTGASHQIFCRRKPLQGISSVRTAP